MAPTSPLNPWAILNKWQAGAAAIIRAVQQVDPHSERVILSPCMGCMKALLQHAAWGLHLPCVESKQDIGRAAHLATTGMWSHALSCTA